ncbi:hypothetical protein BpHYR1_046970 [Brachionus plicatilis]|uniref:Uncharacterized protein n=1 Tax=Brachionus plicatilis TaxID=10195 RepID=A0A3M7SD77_BRAPC|nr:hypothetical protein BpHYR1_046970 [Brachionus plicatilis]
MNSLFIQIFEVAHKSLLANSIKLKTCLKISYDKTSDMDSTKSQPESGPGMDTKQFLARATLWDYCLNLRANLKNISSQLRILELEKRQKINRSHSFKSSSCPLNCSLHINFNT